LLLWRITGDGLIIGGGESNFVGDAWTCPTATAD
jgi:hypothetical protein